jgi:hypothetical protein
MSTLQASMRAAAVDLLTDFAADEGITLQVYPARPRAIMPPTAFVDKIGAKVEYSGLRQQTATAEVVVLFGIFDTAEAADQRDAFVDGFLDWVTSNLDAAGPNSTIGLVALDDEPAYQPDWRPAQSLNGPDAIYYACRITLEGYAGG